jgi:DNA-binding IclR family transcriptional regulator
MLLAKLLDKKILAIIRTMLDDDFFHIQQIAEKSGVPASTTFRLVNKLAKQGILKVKTIGKFKLYTLTEKDEIKKMLGGTK